MRLAARGLRDLDDGLKTIENAAEVAALRQAAKKIYLQTVGIALALTALSLLLPR